MTVTRTSARNKWPNTLREFHLCDVVSSVCQLRYGFGHLFRTAVLTTAPAGSNEERLLEFATELTRRQNYAPAGSAGENVPESIAELARGKNYAPLMEIAQRVRGRSPR